MQGDVQREAGGLPLGCAGGATQGEASHQPPSLAAQDHLRPAKLWAPSKHWEGSPREETATGSPTSPLGLHLLTFINCSIDLDARELERKRVLGSAERTERSVCWDVGGWIHLTTPTQGWEGAVVMIFPASGIKEICHINSFHVTKAQSG